MRETLLLDDEQVTELYPDSQDAAGPRVVPWEPEAAERDVTGRERGAGCEPVPRVWAAPDRAVYRCPQTLG